MERSFALQRGKIDLETGRFPVTLFTNGEASDTHIIDIKGLEVPDHLTMFAMHHPNPIERMGGLVEPHKVGKVTRLGGASLKMTGVIDMEGDGVWPDVRRDVAHGISVGDVKAMSGSWDPIESVPRSSLPKNHYAYSDIEGTWEPPTFFKKAVALEGSIVGLGSDKAALAGRSRDLKKPEHVRKFWDVLVNGDPISREKALACLFVDAAKIDGLEEVECQSVGGKFFVPREMALAWGQSIEDGELGTDVETLLKGVQEFTTSDDCRVRVTFNTDEIEREQISLTGDGDAGTDAEPEDLARLTKLAEALDSGGPTAAGLADRVLDVKAWLQRDVEADLKHIIAYFRDTEFTEPEPVSVPDSQQERSEPVSVPTISATASAAVALLDLPEWPARDDVIQKEIAKRLKEWKATELGYIE